MKKLISYLVGIPATIIVCSETADDKGFILQLGAIVAIIAILALNGVFKREEMYD